MTSNQNVLEEVKHKEFRKEKGKFRIDCNTIIFSDEEIELLINYGHWFTALTDGTLQPFTDLQKEFIKVAKGDHDPFTLEEKTWWKYLRRKEIEQKAGSSLYVTPHLEEDTFYSREQAQQLKSTMYGVIKQTHKE